MSITIAEVEGGKCICGDDIAPIHIDLNGCGEGDHGLILKQYQRGDGDWLCVTETMLPALIDALRKHMESL